MVRVVLPEPAQPASSRDEHVWRFPNFNGNPRHVRMRARPTKDGGHLVSGTDCVLSGGLVNMAESFTTPSRAKPIRRASWSA
ncbi:hypothetical protein SAMN05216371_0089 [Streptomyces sp. TLI_053]|uniref:hypothetical protein n=1 Tax=Streptomyces sp. TLI_053 TaxID=1855352 RepID=UPI00087ACB25|nr:hypothetical protein [Streptomyces sp. TLI_053]SDS52086.1 hypothetical protein SAMN05216371_0089 [Streptomyces sp. TLI_053]